MPDIDIPPISLPAILTLIGMMSAGLLWLWNTSAAAARYRAEGRADRASLREAIAALSGRIDELTARVDNDIAGRRAVKALADTLHEVGERVARIEGRMSS